MDMEYLKEAPTLADAMSVSIVAANNRLVNSFLSFGRPLLEPEAVSVSNFMSYVGTVQSFSHNALLSASDRKSNPVGYFFNQQFSNSAIVSATTSVETALAATPYVRDAIGWASG